MKRFIDLADLTRDEVLSLLELARRLERQPEPHALAGKFLGLVFFNPSLRTLASFQATEARHGGLEGGGHVGGAQQLQRHLVGAGVERGVA